MRRFKHLSFTDRLRIEAMLKAKTPARVIADTLGVHISTVYREKKRGTYTALNSDLTTEERYSPDIAHQQYKEHLSAKGGALKIANDYALAEYIEDKIVHDRYSPAAVLGEIKAKGLTFSTTICKATLYSYIEKGVFLELTNQNLPVKPRKKRKYRKVRQARPPRGESIENRPAEVDGRTTFGHWEMDSVVGRKGTKKTLLVLTERLSRNEVIIPLRDGTSASVVSALNTLERKYGAMFRRIFKTITVDNGSEFSDCAGIEKSCLIKGNRTKLYYCHPYSSWERGTNENQNKMIRRHYPKGTDFRKVTAGAIKQVEDWINRYPREILGFRTAAEVFEECLASVT